MRYNKIAVIDFETTGLSPVKDKVIEFACLELEYDHNYKKFVEKNKINHFVKIGFPIPDFISKLTNITDEMLDNYGIDEIDLGNIIFNLLNDKTLFIAYNLQFDYSFLINLVRRTVDINYKLPCDILDVMVVYKDFYPYPHKLSNAVEELNISIKNTHRAIDDVIATYEVLKILQTSISISKFVNVIGFNPKYPIYDSYKIPNVEYIPQRGNMREIYNRRIV